MKSRCCSRTACKQPPVYTLTYVYRDSTAVLGPLAAYVEPHCYDLCEQHAARLVAPRGWDVVRLPPDPDREQADDLEALANVVRESPRGAGPRGQQRPAGGSRSGASQGGSGTQQPPGGGRPQAANGTRPAGAPSSEPVGQGVEVGRRGHLRVVRSVPSES